MVILFIVLGILLFLFLLWIFSVKGRNNFTDFRDFKGCYFAHRGLHSEGVPENSIAAFENAVKNGYGAEFDVHLLKDGELAVIHDHSLLRTAGVDIQIEDLTLDDLQNYNLEGTEEKIPNIKEVLKIFEGKKPIIIELKAKNNFGKLCSAVADVLKDYNGEYCIESFDPRCVYWFKKNKPKIIRGQLSENFFKNDKNALPFHLKIVMSFLMTNFWAKPDFVAYRFSDRNHIANKICLKLWKMQGFCWTMVNQADINIANKEKLISIFENIKP